MLNLLISRVLSAPDSPTADLYFRNACRDFLDTGVRQLGPTVFASESACLVMRHAMRAGRLPDRRRLIYLIDDDVAAGTSDVSLPFFYRQKLRMVEGPASRRIKRVARVAVVGSPALGRLFAPLMETHLLRPYWSEPFAALDHFQPLAARTGWIEMAFLGSVIHRSDLAFVLPVVRRLLEAHPRLRFHVPERHRLPGDLDRHKRVRRIEGLGWTAYRRTIANRRFHIALYPLLDTAFNRARSANKLIEHAVVGAAPVYSHSWREAARASATGAGLCLPNEREVWFQALSALIDSPREMADRAAATQRLAAKLNTPEPQRRLWGELLGVAAPAGAAAPV